jgi:hypothetical protein
VHCSTRAPKIPVLGWESRPSDARQDGFGQCSLALVLKRPISCCPFAALLNYRSPESKRLAAGHSCIVAAGHTLALLTTEIVLRLSLDIAVLAFISTVHVLAGMH